MRRRKWMLDIFAVVLMAVHILPFYVLLTVAFKVPTDGSPKWFFPNYLQFDNFVGAWTSGKLSRAFVNNTVITFSVIILVVVISSMAAYPLARYRTKFNNFIYAIFIACMIVPPLSPLVPLYKFIVDIGGMNKLWSVILLMTNGGLPMAIFLLVGFITTVPRELDESAVIDGAHPFTIFYRIIIPILKPAIATIVILVGVGAWNDYSLGLFFLQKPSVMNLTVSISKFFAQYSSEVNKVAAGCLISLVPITLLYLSAQKYFIKGLSAGAVKG